MTGAKESFAARIKELEDLATHLQRVAESERAAIARELHGNFGSLLAAAKFDVNWLMQHSKIDSDAASRAKLTHLSKMLDQALKLEQQLAERLRAALLDHFGLAIALQGTVEKMCKQASIECSVKVPDSLGELGVDLQLALFRIAQAAVEDAVQGGARTLELTLERLQESIAMRLTRDGAKPDGDDGERTQRISAMRHRIASFGGRLEIDERRGTRIAVSAPLVSAAR
jgi:two-component system, NarL family, sensor histidine kinase UhpB